MMYHFFGGASPGAASSPASATATTATSSGSGAVPWAGGSSTGSPLTLGLTSGLSSAPVSSSKRSISSDSIFTLLREKVQNARDALHQQAVHHREIRRESEHREDHHYRRAFHLLAVRPSHAAHLELQLVDVVPRALNPLHHFSHKSSLAEYSQLSYAVVGRGGGIRTPTRGFGDRWSAVKPTPLGRTPVCRGSLQFYLISLCGRCCRQCGQNFFSSKRSVVVFLFFVEE